MFLKIKLNFFFFIINKELYCLYDLLDVLEEILFLKRGEWYELFFVYYDVLVGVNFIVMKLLYNL